MAIIIAIMITIRKWIEKVYSLTNNCLCIYVMEG